MTVTSNAPERGAAEALEHMTQWQRDQIGRSTLEFVRMVMRDPELRQLLQKSGG